MSGTQYVCLVLRALWEFARYDIVLRLFGFAYVQRQVRNCSRAPKPSCPDLAREFCDAIELATCLYWKPVLCLQRSVCAVRLLRKSGASAKLVVGYRPAPFFSHAWVEVDGKIVNGSPAYQRLQILYSL
ncbi:MAG TPA: lasso peptide biosynthesis B2 protein [Candidatus Acidoferrales bacterium]|nr:lasso peptide biosynthesis B2 protein [Candidatus Acidoferrales bacterium]HXK06825.1 lasso peptide biosynthesis B2 protein [Verrucomicrobiae bacterium]